MDTKEKEIIQEPVVHYSKSGSPSVSSKEILESEAGKKELKKLSSIKAE